jgi:hypothetical protein
MPRQADACHVRAQHRSNARKAQSISQQALAEERVRHAPVAPEDACA